MSETHMKIHGRWDDSDEEPWEWFTIQLFGEEAGDVMTDFAEIKRVLAEAGYELVRTSEQREKA